MSTLYDDLVAELDRQIEREYNPFEPHNQSAASKRMTALRQRVMTEDPLGEAYAEGRDDEAQEHAWRPIETAPEDTNILVATQGGWVDTAFWTDEDGEGRKWWWLVSANKHAEHPIHPNLVPTHWMPLPKHPHA